VFPESAESLQVTRDKRCKSVAQEVKMSTSCEVYRGKRAK
jgi:hypothetical protein